MLVVVLMEFGTSEVKGSYTFDFTNVKATNEEKISWIKLALKTTKKGKKNSLSFSISLHTYTQKLLKIKYFLS